MAIIQIFDNLLLASPLALVLAVPPGLRGRFSTGSLRNEGELGLSEVIRS